MRLKQLQLGIGSSLVALALLALAGCSGGKKFSADDFKKVEKGASEDKVKEQLGKPMDSKEYQGVKHMWWKVDDNYYNVIIKDGKVEATSGPSKKEEYELWKALMEKATK